MTISDVVTWARWTYSK